MISEYVYRKILKKLDLSKKELIELRKRLTERQVCCGPFVKKKKMCPTTTALSIKLDRREFKDNEEVSRKLKEFGISKFDLYLLYLTFDIPSMISKRWFGHCLKRFRKTVENLFP